MASLSQGGLSVFIRSALAVGAVGLIAGCSSDQATQSGQSWPPGTSVAQGELAPLDMYYTDIRGEDYGRQLDVVAPYLEEKRDASKATFGANELPDPTKLSGDKKWVQEVLNRISYDIKTASLEQNTTLGRNLLSGVYGPGAESMLSMSALIGNGQGEISARKMVDAVSERFSSGEIDFGTRKIDIKTDTILANIIDMNNASVWNMYISTYASQDGEHKVPVIVAMVSPENRNFRSGDLVPTWRPKPS
ncbi:hypothetical protein [Mycobacterium sp. SMC-4]|uniref:hypothetical protein n=1 Tax=Mycobacterium sp. SMC-4 TaxID=2857059 RepID=UPI0021B2DC93|nr:hypothetical protein [Mycobacterium sp. SMC-4]UXA19089.1 hypothetical protein KXD98_05400 [Mycobacterium sp. SMC-4]